MTPPFDIDGGLALALCRAFSVATLILAFGTLLYVRVVAPPSLPEGAAKNLRRFAGWTLCAAFLGALVWLAAQTQDLAGSFGIEDIWGVLLHTVFGHLLTARLVLLLIAAALWDMRREAAALLCCGLALVLQAGHSHGVAMGGPAWLIGAATLHVLAAGAWLGALPALALVVRSQDFPIATAAASRFSPLGMVCVATLLLTAAAQFFVLVMGLPGLLGTAYGWMICAKSLGFIALLALAAGNRFRLTPALAAATPAAKSRLTRAILAEIFLGLLVVAAAGVLTELQPPMHLQPIWPFGWLPSLGAAREDPDIAHEVTVYGAVFALGAALLVAALVMAFRRRKMLATGSALAGAVLAGFATPHFAPLLVPAEPTIFYHSPTGFTAIAIDAGKTLFAEHCVTCHGDQGRGDGPAAKTLPVPPADLTAPHLWMHSDGELFWWLAHGIEAPEGGLAMPGFGKTLSDGDRWSLIDYIRANNAGLSAHPGGRWTMQVHAPDFALVCDGKPQKLSDLRGTPVRILFNAAALAPSDLKTVLVGATPPADAKTCHAEDPGIVAAYQIVTGAQPSAVLVDANGWLRQSAADAAALNAKATTAPMPAQDAMPMNMKM